MNKFIFSPIFALILGLANNLIVPFVGEVTGSFILIILTMPFWLSQIDQNDKIIKWALKLFLCLLLVQLNPEKPDVPLNKNDAFQKVQKRRVQEKR